MNTASIPDNLPECFDLIQQECSPASLERLRQRTQEELTREHFGWGLWLRNRFIHPIDSPIREKIANLPLTYGHNDSYGQILLVALWLHLRGETGEQPLLEQMEAQWQEVLEIIKSSPEDFHEAVEGWEHDRPTLEHVLPLFQQGP